MTFRVDRAFALYFVRHGITEQNMKGLRCGGDVDIPLTDIGCDQAYLLAKHIKLMDVEIGVIVSSSLIRARQTALIISGVLGGIPVETESLLNERRLGEWNGRPIADTEALLAQNVTPPGGESEVEFAGRIEGALESLRPHLDQCPLVVSSRGVGRIFNNLLGGQGRLHVANGEVVKFAVMRESTGNFALQVIRSHDA